jgi:hypothetical protein
VWGDTFSERRLLALSLAPADGVEFVFTRSA